MIASNTISSVSRTISFYLSGMKLTKIIIIMRQAKIIMSRIFYLFLKNYDSELIRTNLIQCNFIQVEGYADTKNIL